MTTTNKKKFILRIPLRKLNEAKKRQKEKEKEEILENNDIYTDDDIPEEQISKNIGKQQDEKEIKEVKEVKEIITIKEENKSKCNEVDREYENLMAESIKTEELKFKNNNNNNVNNNNNKNTNINTNTNANANTIENDNWIQNEKHAISMRHISIRDDKKKLLQSFLSKKLDNQQFKFIKLNLETYFSLKNYKIDDNLFNLLLKNNQSLTQLFNITETNNNINNKIIEIINDLEQSIMEKHFSIQKEDKTVKFTMENYQKTIQQIKGKFEACPLLYVLLLNHWISFKKLLESDMTEICLICINTIIRKKISRRLESLVKRENAKAIETLLFNHYKKIHKNDDMNSENDNELCEKYINFSQIYLKFLMSFPNYRNLIIKNNNEINKIFNLTKEQLLNPPPLQLPINDKNINNNSDNNNLLPKKRKHFQTTIDLTSDNKKRKIILNDNAFNNNNTNNNNCIYNGLLINDNIKCHIKIKQIGGKLIWTLPFRNINNNKQLSISGRINISSIIKFIKQLKKHKTRRILFAEIENNEYVNYNSYNVLSEQLYCSGKAGVIDFEKQCGILIYILSSQFLLPNHSISHQLNKYFNPNKNNKIKLPKTKIFSIIILSLDVYNQVKKKTIVKKKYHKYRNNNNKNNNKNKTNNNDNIIDDVWDKLGNEIEDDLGQLPPPLPAHLLAERERYKNKKPPPPPPPNMSTHIQQQFTIQQQLTIQQQQQQYNRAPVPPPPPRPPLPPTRPPPHYR